MATGIITGIAGTRMRTDSRKWIREMISVTKSSMILDDDSVETRVPVGLCTTHIAKSRHGNDAAAHKELFAFGRERAAA